MTKRPVLTLDEVFQPRSVALVGVSAENWMSYAAFALMSLKEAGFPAIYPVNPKYSEVSGLPCFPSVSAIPGPVDHVIVCVAASRVLELLDDCARKGVLSVHFFTAGFRESGERQGIELEEAMLEKARAAAELVQEAAHPPQLYGAVCPQGEIDNGASPAHDARAGCLPVPERRPCPGPAPPCGSPGADL